MIRTVATKLFLMTGFDVTAVAPDGTLRADGKKARDPSREVESSFNLSHGRAQLP